MCHYGNRAVFWLCTICNYFLLLLQHILFVSSIWAMVFQILSPFRAVDQCSYNSSPSSTIPHFFLRPITNSGWFMPPMIGVLFATTPPACPEAQLGRAQGSIGWLTYWTVKGHNVSKLGNHYRPSADLYSLLFAAKRHTLPIGWRLAKFITN